MGGAMIIITTSWLIFISFTEFIIIKMTLIIMRNEYYAGEDYD